MENNVSKTGCITPECPTRLSENNVAHVSWKNMQLNMCPTCFDNLYTTMHEIYKTACGMYVWES